MGLGCRYRCRCRCRCKHRHSPISQSPTSRRRPGTMRRLTDQYHHRTLPQAKQAEEVCPDVQRSGSVSTFTKRSPNRKADPALWRLRGLQPFAFAHPPSSLGSSCASWFPVTRDGLGPGPGSSILKHRPITRVCRGSPLLVCSCPQHASGGAQRRSGVVVVVFPPGTSTRMACAASEPGRGGIIIRRRRAEPAVAGDHDSSRPRGPAAHMRNRGARTAAESWP